MSGADSTTPAARPPWTASLLPEFGTLMQDFANPDASVRRAAAMKLGRAVRERRDELCTLMPALLSGLADADADVRWLSAFGLGAGGEPGAVVPALAAALADPRPEVRDAAAFSLQFFGDDAAAAVPALLEALGDRDLGVRESAGMALLAIGPASIPGSAELFSAITRGDRELPAFARRLRERLAAN